MAGFRTDVYSCVSPKNRKSIHLVANLQSNIWVECGYINPFLEASKIFSGIQKAKLTDPFASIEKRHFPWQRFIQNCLKSQAKYTSRKLDMKSKCISSS